MEETQQLKPELASTGEQIPIISKRRKRRWPVALARVLLMLLFVAGFVFSMVPWGRAVARSTQILPALLQ